MSKPQIIKVPDGAAGSAITARKAPDSRCTEFLPLHFGAAMTMRGETALFGWMARVSVNYAGGDISATLFALNQLIWLGHDGLRKKHGQRLAYVAQRPERGLIRNVTD